MDKMAIFNLYTQKYLANGIGIKAAVTVKYQYTRHCCHALTFASVKLFVAFDVKIASA